MRNSRPECSLAWAQHNVRRHITGIKHFHHPVVGDLSLVYDRMNLAADPGLTIFTYTAEPGTRHAETLKLLGSWGRDPRTTRCGPHRRTHLTPRVSAAGTHCCFGRCPKASVPLIVISEARARTVRGRPRKAARHHRRLISAGPGFS